MVDTVVQVPATDTTKPAWKSYTLWTAAITAGLPFIPIIGPQISVWMAANPANQQAYGVALGVLFAGLRLITKNRLVISKTT